MILRCWLQVRYGGSSVVIQVIDVCSSCSENAIGLLQPQLYGLNTQTGVHSIPVLYRQVRTYHAAHHKEIRTAYTTSSRGIMTTQSIMSPLLIGCACIYAKLSYSGHLLILGKQKNFVTEHSGCTG